MRIDTGLGNLKRTLTEVSKKLVRKTFTPDPSTDTGEKSIPGSDNVQPPRYPPSRTEEKVDLKRAYQRVLGQIFGKLDDHQKTLFARLFPDLEAGQRFVESQDQIVGKKMKSHIQFLTTPTSDTPGTSLLLHFDDKRYLVGNMHEGIQRAGIQVGTKFTKVQDIFLTGKTEWQTTGGLLGLVLTLADSTAAASLSLVEHAKKKFERERARLGDGAAQPPRLPSAADIRNSKAVLNIHGGPNLLHLFATARMFIFRKGVPLRILEHEARVHTSVNPDRDPDWADDNIRVWKMAITNSATASSPKSPRKRSFSEYAGTGSLQYITEVRDSTEGSSNSYDSDQEIRRNVVSEMFESSWRLDNLEEVPLSDVSGPAVMFIRDPQTNKLQRYIPPPNDDNTPLPNINVLMRKAWPGALVDSLPISMPSPIAMSYIIRNHRQRGKFLASKAKELKVPPGPLFSKLANGEDVLSAEGTIVTPDMVLGTAKEGGGIAVIDLPSKDYVENLINRPEWESQSTMVGVGAVLWMLGKDVGRDTRIQAFMNDHPQWKHIVSSPDSCPNYLAMSSSASSAIRLNRLNRNFFPIPVHDNSLPSQHDGLPCETAVTANIVAAQRGLMCQLEPKVELQDTAIIPHLQTGQLLENVPNYALELAQAAREEIAAELPKSSANQALPSPNAEIITLGTGSALPSKYRNVSATLLRVPGCGSYLLDCGENTLGQLKRVYGDEGLKEVLRDLKLIWISHLHADHHLGTVSVIKAWRDEIHGQIEARDDGQASNQLEGIPLFSSMAEIANPVKVLQDENRLIITGTGQMMKWLQEYAGVEYFGYDKIIPLESAAPWGKNSPRFHLKWHHRHVGFGKESEALKKATGLSDMAAVQVPHCWNAQAVALTFPTGFKLSYSGDCRPSKEFAKIGKGSTVLVHEATFDDELQGDAEAKKHSTTSEAIGVGMAMGAKRVILTHFSQRYQKIPVMENMGFMGVKLEDAEETGEAETPMVDASFADLPNDAIQEDVVMQIDDDAATKGSLDENESSQQHSGACSEPGVSFNHPPKSPKTPSRPASSHQPSVAASPTAINEMKICVAFDYMRVKVSEIAHMEKYAPALLELYQQENVDEEAEKDTTTQGQTYNESEKENRRKDESDDESHKGEKKKSNEEINRGKSKRQLRKEERQGRKSDARKEQEQDKRPNDAIDAESLLPPTKNVSGGKSSPNQERSTVDHWELQAEKARSDALGNTSSIRTSNQDLSTIGIPFGSQKSWSDIQLSHKAEAAKIIREHVAHKDVSYSHLEYTYKLIGSSIKQTHLELGDLDRTMTRQGWGRLLTAAKILRYNKLMSLAEADNLPTTTGKASRATILRKLRRKPSLKARGLGYSPIPSSSKSPSNTKGDCVQQRSTSLPRLASTKTFTYQKIEPNELCNRDGPGPNSEPPNAKFRVMKYPTIGTPPIRKTPTTRRNQTAKTPLVKRYTIPEALVRRFPGTTPLVKRYRLERRHAGVRRTPPKGRSPPIRSRKPGARKGRAQEPSKLSNWDSMLANVGREVEIDLTKADQHWRAPDVRAL